MSAGFNLRRERPKPGARIRQMMQHANRERVIKLSRQRQPVDVGLNDVHVWQRTRRGKCSFNCAAEIYPDYVSRAPTRGELRVPALAATSLEHHLVAKKLGRYRRDPAEKLLSVTLIFVREMLPLPAKVIRCCTFITLNFRQISEARHTGVNGKGTGASVTTQSAFDYFQVFDALDRNLKRAIAGRTHEIRE